MDRAKSEFFALKTCVLTFAIGLRLVSAMPAAQVESSLTESEIEKSADALAFKAASDEVRVLQAKLASSETSVAGLQKSLTIANSESEVFRRQAAELKLRLETLGIEAGALNSGKLEQRLLRAANDFKIVDDERKSLKEALIQLSEAVLTFQKNAVTTDADARVALEVEMRGTARALGVAPPAAVIATAVSPTLSDGAVISIKDDLALVVANFGTAQGVKVGMPFKVQREGNTIGTVQVVDVREKISGAVIQNLNSESERIKVGDRLVVDARQ